MKLSLYTLPYDIANETAKINRLFELGLEELHIRKPRNSYKQTRKYIQEIDETYHNRLIIHEHYTLLNEFNLKGIHTSKSYFSGLIGKINRWNLPDLTDKTLSTTVSRLSDLTSIDHKFDKVFVGPVFTKYSQHNTKTNFDSFELKNKLSQVEKPIYALGGIEQSKVQRLLNIGFNGMVLQSAIWKSDNIVNAYEAFQMLTATPKTNKQSVQVNIA